VLSEVSIAAKVQNRSIAGQIEHWIKIGKIAEENPDLPYELVKSILTAQEELRAGLGRTT